MARSRGNVTTQPIEPRAERRQSHRIKVCGVAVLRAGNTCAVGRIADLSTGGIAFRVLDMAGIAHIAVGDVVEIDLQLDPHRAFRVSHEGTIRHVDAAAGRLGIAFTGCPARLQDTRVAPVGAPPPLRVLDGMGATQRPALRWWRRT